LKILIILLLLVILGSLAAGMGFIVKDGGKSRRTLRALTLRITLSLLLFGLLLVGYFGGYLKPHGLIPPAPQGEQAPAQSQ
jgi:hypothetical protein